MLSKPVLDLMTEQINHELYSAYFYLSMSAHCDAETWPGVAHWLRMQAQEEQEHALKFYDYILDRGEKVTLKAIAQPPVEFGSLVSIFEQVYAHEQKVTALIEKIYAAALEQKDVASQALLQWFITEQVEEEKNASEILEMLKRVGSSVGGMYQIDHNLAKRG